ncbi:MAG: AAA family ATPase [Selenomonadaceae bacterium]|nr:AAA family ATPase [Selenomonadaceae bacterium]
MQERKRPMPVGIEDFGDLIRKDYYFVDKTRFIRDLLDFQTPVTLITRPRRFGKTLTLSMLRYFFDLENGEENRELFRGLDIERAGEKYMREQGTRPVVFLTLKEVQRPTYASMLTMLASVLQEVYSCHRQMLNNSTMEESQAEYAGRILAGKGTEEELVVSLKRFMSYLEEYHGKKPILLLDEYDAPILSAWENGYYKECIDFMRGFLGSAFKTNPSLGFAVLTGVTRVSKESIFSGLNNLKVCSVLSDTYCDIFGFTQGKQLGSWKNAERGINCRI